MRAIISIALDGSFVGSFAGSGSFAASFAGSFADFFAGSGSCWRSSKESGGAAARTSSFRKKAEPGGARAAPGGKPDRQRARAVSPLISWMIGPGVFTIELWAAQSPGETHAYGGEGRNTHKKVVTKCESGRHRTTHATSATRMHEHSLHHRHEFGSITTFRLSPAAAHVDFAANRLHRLPPDRARHRKVLRAEDPHRSLRPLLQELRWRGRQRHNVVFRRLLVQLLQTSLVLKRLHVRTQVRQKARGGHRRRGAVVTA